MKQKLILFALLLTLGTVQLNAQPKHRHHAVAAVVDSSATATPDDEGIEAYSDTTSLAADDAQADYDDEPVTTTNTRVSHNPDDYDDPISWLESFTTVSLGFGGIMLAILVVLLVFLVLLSPIIIIAIVLRYMIRRHNDQVTLAEKAMETGTPIPDELMPVDKQSDDYLRRRGIRNICIGIGMAIMFGIWDASMLEGVGFLVLCYGIGQVLIARSSQKRNNDLKD